MSSTAIHSVVEGYRGNYSFIHVSPPFYYRVILKNGNPFSNPYLGLGSPSTWLSGLFMSWCQVPKTPRRPYTFPVQYWWELTPRSAIIGTYGNQNWLSVLTSKPWLGPLVLHWWFHSLLCLAQVICQTPCAW